MEGQRTYGYLSERGRVPIKRVQRVDAFGRAEMSVYRYRAHQHQPTAVDKCDRPTSLFCESIATRLIAFTYQSIYHHLRLLRARGHDEDVATKKAVL